MSAGDELRNAVNSLQRAAQMKRDELRAVHDQIGKNKNDTDKIILALTAELGLKQQMSAQATDGAIQSDLNTQISAINSQIQTRQQDLQHTISRLDQEARALEGHISVLEQRARDVGGLIGSV